MSKRWWTADAHFGHGNIIRYCNRPFRDIEHMNERLIAGILERTRPGDSLIHVGDFACRGNEKSVEGLRLPWTFYADQIKARLVLLEGNHDKQNKVKTVGRHLFCRIGHFSAFVSHLPTDNEDHDPLLMDYVRRTCDFAVCGHVHDSWTTKECNGILNVNVGVDAHRYRPISDDELLAVYLKEKK